MESSKLTIKDEVPKSAVPSIAVKAKVSGTYRARAIKKGDVFQIPHEYSGRTSSNLGLRYFNPEWMEIVDHKVLLKLQEASDEKAKEAPPSVPSSGFVPEA